jgi:hypothetical protein
MRGQGHAEPGQLGGARVDGAGLGAVGLAAAGAFKDLGTFVVGDHALELDQQRVLGAVPAWAPDEHDTRAGLGELLDQKRLVGVLRASRSGE